MTLATGIAVASLLALPGCDRGGDDAKPGVSPSTSASASESSGSIADKADLVGDWEDVEAQWAVHFNEDGTFVEDFQGIVDFRVGTYDISGETVSLIGDDGNTTTGTVTGVTLVFKLGTLIRS
ncbi:hypothetical protein GCM10022234_03050 [Aeromicrobium panaciterrae]|uniref:hypothetical protein n=1 Tax=Aeromicrobium panaciterrae TaxID=363861 RepID=UPI0031E197A4